MEFKNHRISYYELFPSFRFTKEEKARHNPFDWIPFGSGPRNCVAMRLALTEVKIAIAYVVKNYKLLRGSETEVRIFLPVNIFVSSQITCYVALGLQM